MTWAVFAFEPPFEGPWLTEALTAGEPRALAFVLEAPPPAAADRLAPADGAGAMALSTGRKANGRGCRAGYDTGYGGGAVNQKISRAWPGARKAIDGL